MPKVKPMKFYAVAVGRNAPNIYTAWDECSAKVSRYPNALHKSFKTRSEAEQWLKSKASMTALCCKENPRVFATGTPNSPIPIDSEDEPQANGTVSPMSDLPEQRAVSPKEQDGIQAKSKEEKNDAISNCAVSSDLKAQEQKVVLSKEQSTIYAKVKKGRNVFFTGSAGTGKSVLLREIIKLKRDYNFHSESLAITASTGIAALNIGGVTLHSWAGIRLGDEPVDKFIRKVLHSRSCEAILERWRTVETLIIDELSMIDASLFDYLEKIARELRRSLLPFGGIQLVLCGDFCQLPPVSGKDNKGREIPARFAFEAQAWNDCIGTPMLLRKVFRQKDQTFANMLNEMRYGNMQDSTIKIFKSLSRSVTYTDGIEPTEMYPTRKEVTNANTWRLNGLPGEPHVYNAQDHRGVDHKNEQISHERMLDLLDKLIAPKRLEVKVGAQVMLIKNMMQGVLVNGSIGQVIRFDTPTEAASSGTRIAQAEMDTDKRGKPKDQSVTEEILKYDWKWPVVKFTNGMEFVVTPQDFTVTNGDGETMMARRLQLPLILAWALSVHKAQGQTLERVRVDLRRTFEKGQAYVALSRATTMEHLQVLNFSKEKVMAHPKVLAWYGETTNKPDDIIQLDDDELLLFNQHHHW